MSLFSTTLPAQPPPLHPRSPYDVASFDILTKSLRSHPDLSTESDKILNSFQLAKFVDGVRRFQDDHLGLKNKYRPSIRLPSPLFHDRSTSGPLFHAIVSAFKVKQASPWRNFNFDNPKLFDDNIALLKRMEGDLINAGLLKRPRIYFDKSIDQEETKRLADIAEKHGASVTLDESEVASGKVTHVVVYDPEEHDGPSVLEEEKEETTEKQFLRTLGIFDIPLEGEGDTLQTKRMALVHWWYFPSSYDEWIDASDVSGDLEKENPSSLGSANVVGCKFIRDVERFNEWGVESDYAVMDFETKLEYLRTHPNAMASSNSSSKKRKKQTTKGGAADSEPSSKKARRGSTESVTLISEQMDKANSNTRTTSDRRIIKGTDFLGARRIQTGFKGARGEAIRRTVYDGALRVDDEAYKIVRDALAEFGGEPPLLAGKPEWRKFSSANALNRPTVDSTLGKSITVTELTVSQDEDGGTNATNCQIPVLSVLDGRAAESDETMRIRGGGDEDGQINNPAPEALEAKGIGAPESSQMATGETEMGQNAAAGVIVEPASTNVGQEELQAETATDKSADQAPIETTEPIPALQESNEPIASLGTTETTPPAALAGEVQLEEDVTGEMRDATPSAEDSLKVEMPQSAPEPDTSTPDETATVDMTASSENNLNQNPVATVAESKNSKPEAEISSGLCQIKPLQQAHQLTSSLYNPNTSSNMESIVPAFRPAWYDQTKASDFEQRSLPEWFNQSAPHRTPASYVTVREQILDIAKKNTNQYITATALRRSISCDSGSIMRMHSFLTDWGFINAAQVGESAPSEIKMRSMRAAWNEGGKLAKRKFADVERSIIWSPARIQALETFVVANIAKKKASDGRTLVEVDWDQVSKKLGMGVTAKECQYVFVQPPNNGPVPIPPSTDSSVTQSQDTLFSSLIDSVQPDVLKQVIDTALNSTQNIDEARKAAFIGAVATVAAKRGQEEETQIQATLMDIVDQRVQRLENRIAMIDDVEALLEAERVSLELERRDMYTTRCRQWFGDGSS